MKKKYYNWQPKTQPKRNKKIVELREKTRLSYRALGRIFGLSHSRIAQIIKKFRVVEK